jgi:hypothetical protein
MRFSISSKSWLEILLLFLNQFIAEKLSRDEYIMKAILRGEGE